MSEINGKYLPLVSIVVSTYRRDSTLKRALLSLAKQTYSQLEIIVVDDNADIKWNNKVESILKLVKGQMKTTVIYIKNKENMGSAETRNIGIKRATGSYITFLDDDDIYLPNKVKNQVEHMIINKSDYSITDLDLYDEKERLIEKRNRKYIEEFTREKLIKYHLMYHMTGTDVMMFRKDYLLQIGGFSPINVGDEFYLMQKAIEANGKFSYLPVCDVKAYIHTKTSGLSSGEGKINGENALFEYKKSFFPLLSRRDVRFIIMRHYAVLSFAEIRRQKRLVAIKYAILALLSSPFECIRLLVKRY